MRKIGSVMLVSALAGALESPRNRADERYCAHSPISRILRRCRATPSCGTASKRGSRDYGRAGLIDGLQRSVDGTSRPMDLTPHRQQWAHHRKFGEESYCQNTKTPQGVRPSGVQLSNFFQVPVRLVCSNASTLQTRRSGG